MLRLLGLLHGRLVHARRVRVIAEALAPWLPADGIVIDVGAGDGAVAAHLLARRPGLRIEGYDVMARENAAIPIHAFDGRRLPLGDRSVDAVILVDVLHHCDSPADMLKEALRVSRGLVLIKDHRLGYPGAGTLLAAIILGIAESFTATFYGPSWAPAVSFGLLLLTLAIRPAGLLGR